MIETVIKPNRLDAVETALAKMDVGFVPRVLLKICVNDTDVEQAANVIIEAAPTGEVGDGRIFVYPITEVVRIRTGERNESAV